MKGTWAPVGARCDFVADEENGDSVLTISSCAKVLLAGVRSQPVSRKNHPLAALSMRTDAPQELH